MPHAKPGKPRAVLQAEWVLWAWAAWTLAFGVYQALFAAAGNQDVVDQLQSLFAIPPSLVLEITIAGYLVAALSMIWVIFKIGDGRRWARASLLLSFVIEALWVANQSSSSTLDIFADIPDFGFQIWALCLLFTSPGREWFRKTSV